MVILGDPRHYGRYGFWCGERWGISLESGSTCPASRQWSWPPAPWQTRALQELSAAGRFRGFPPPSAAALDAF